METEIWKDIPGYEGLYQISSVGNIKSLGKGKTHKTSKILNTYSDGGGYYFFRPCKDGKQSMKKIHRLVAESFISKIKGKEYVNHIDGNKSNNKISNLEWCTSSENQLHSQRVLGNKNHFKYNNPSKLKKGKLSPVSRGILQFDLNLNFINEYDSITEAANILNINRRLISATCIGKQKTTRNFIFKYK